MKRIAFVPARGGSTRVPRKNLKLIGGIPLFLRACYNLSQVLEKECIIVDSEEEEILEIADRHGFGRLRRPRELADNRTDGNAFFRWETSNYPEADIYLQHLPPMAFCSKDTILRGINAIETEGYDSIVCVGKEHYYLWDTDKRIPCYDIASIPNSYTLKETTFETMGLYAISAKAHKKNGRRIGDHYKFVEVNKFEQVDINYPEDFELAAAIERGLPEGHIYKTETLLKSYNNTRKHTGGGIY